MGLSKIWEVVLRAREAEVIWQRQGTLVNDNLSCTFCLDPNDFASVGVLLHALARIVVKKTKEPWPENPADSEGSYRAPSVIRYVAISAPKRERE